MILSLPSIVSVSITICLSALFSVIFYFVIHPLWSGEISEDTKKTADVIATRVGVVFAVVIGMMFANVRTEHAEMIQAIESEASALTRIYQVMERKGAEESLEIQKDIIEYIRFIVDEQWPALREARFQTEDFDRMDRVRLERIWDYAIKNEKKLGDSSLVRLLDQVEHYRILRLFDIKGNLLPFFWYIAIFGYLGSLVTLYVPPPTFRRCALIAIYSSLVALVLLGIYILSHPYSKAAGIEPNVFKLLLKVSGN